MTETKGRTSRAAAPGKLIKELTRTGLKASGTPPAVSVTVGGIDVSVELKEDDPRVALVAHVSGGGKAPSDLTGPSLSAPGDTSYTVDASGIHGARTLVEPSVGALYDAIYELAKGAASLRRLVEDLGRLQAGQERPTPAEPQVTPVAPSTEQATQPVAAQPAPTWAPTHVVPAGGLAAWAEPDPAAAPVAELAGGVELQVVEVRGAWSKVIGSNGWSGWVDGRRLAVRPR